MSRSKDLIEYFGTMNPCLGLHGYRGTVFFNSISFYATSLIILFFQPSQRVAFHYLINYDLPLQSASFSDYTSQNSNIKTEHLINNILAQITCGETKKKKRKRKKKDVQACSNACVKILIISYVSKIPSHNRILPTRELKTEMLRRLMFSSAKSEAIHPSPHAYIQPTIKQ